MKVFDIGELPAKAKPYQILSEQATSMIKDICQQLNMSLDALHAALWVFHCNSLIVGYQHFDRYMYACGAVLVGGKLTQCLRYPVSILQIVRKLLRKKKGLEDVDSEQYLKREVRRVLDAEINIMINIGFDFDIQLALEQAQKLKIYQALGDENMIVKYKNTLTSLYKTEVVVFYHPQTIACLGLDILLKMEGKNIELMDFEQELKQNLINPQIHQSKKEYLKRCGMI